MTGTVLKLIAVVTMVADHIGYVLFPDQLWLRMIGRLSLPIFAFLIVEGYSHTHDRRSYLIRLSAFALLSEIPYDLAFSGQVFDWQSQNIFFTLAAGLGAVWACGLWWKKRRWLAIPAVAVLAALCEFLYTDYGAYGVLLIVAFYLFRKQRPAMAVATVALTLFYVFFITAAIQFLAVLAMVPIWFYNGKQGKKLPRYFFYGFYPAHLLLLYGIHLAI